MSELADVRAAGRVRAWAEARDSPRKRAASLAKMFERGRLTPTARNAMDVALQACGVATAPSLLTCAREDWLRLEIVGPPAVSDQVPSQLVTWHEFNWAAGGEERPSYGEWLRCLKATVSHQRQLVYSADAVRGMVTFSGWVRPGHGFYDGWATLIRLTQPVERDALLGHPRTASRFDDRGIKALQGNPITLKPEIAVAIAELAGGLPATDMPLDEPDYSEEAVLWVGSHGLAPEAQIEAAVAARRGLWKRLGFPSAPLRQRHLGAAGRPDLLAGDVVGEAKRAVTVKDGPDQIDRYLTHLECEHGRPAKKLRGVLIQCASETNDRVLARLADSDYDVSLWHVSQDGRWRARRLD